MKNKEAQEVDSRAALIVDSVLSLVLSFAVIFFSLYLKNGDGKDLFELFNSVLQFVLNEFAVFVIFLTVIFIAAKFKKNSKLLVKNKKKEKDS